MWCEIRCKTWHLWHIQLNLTRLVQHQCVFATRLKFKSFRTFDDKTPQLSLKRYEVDSQFFWARCSGLPDWGNCQIDLIARPSLAWNIITMAAKEDVSSADQFAIVREMQRGGRDSPRRRSPSYEPPPPRRSRSVPPGVQNHNQLAFRIIIKLNNFIYRQRSPSYSPPRSSNRRSPPYQAPRRDSYRCAIRLKWL